MELLYQRQRCTTSVLWPEDVDRRLNILVRAAAAAGERTSRAELLAALVTAVEVAPEQVSALLRHYRSLPADALTGDEARSDLPVVRAPGPRRGTPS
ncbi:hypothetical protein ABTX82_40700 [Streptomyces lavendulae]|uniref:hypothetical protein n=1 Tax=Streptomyces lavendulae TaxID=1914 RepID=UPI00331DA8A7